MSYELTERIIAVPASAEQLTEQQLADLTPNPEVTP